MTPPMPIHSLRDRLEMARSEAVRSLASLELPVGEIPTAALERLAHLHMALLSVRDEIEQHGPRLGHTGDATAE
jgi:hypothetical protein